MMLSKILNIAFIVISGIAAIINIGLTVWSVGYLINMIINGGLVDSFGTPGRAIIMIVIFMILSIPSVVGVITGIRNLKVK